MGKARSYLMDSDLWEEFGEGLSQLTLLTGDP